MKIGQVAGDLESRGKQDQEIGQKRYSIELSSYVVYWHFVPPLYVMYTKIYYGYSSNIL